MRTTVGVTTRGILTLLCAASLSGALCGCSRDRGAALRPDYGAVESSVYELEQVTQTNQAVAITGERGIAERLTARFRVRTLETSEDGGARVGVSLERLTHSTLGQSALAVDFDSARGDAENKPASLLPVYSAVLGAEAVVTMGASGVAGEVAGLDEIEAAMGASRSGRLLGELYGPKWWSELAESVFLVDVQGGAVRTGDSWTTSRTSSQEQYFTLSELVEHEVVTVTRQRVEIEQRGGFTVDMSKDAYAEAEGGKLDEQAIAGRIVWDRQRGRLVERREERVLQLSQSHQGLDLAKRYSMMRSVRRVVAPSRNPDPGEPDAG